MSDLRALLHDTATPSTDTSAAVADAHLAHARRALRRRNAKRVSIGSTLVAAAAITAFAVGGDSTAPASPVAQESTKTATNTSDVKLVAYSGAQPTGYTLDKVPAGWVIDHDDLSLLTLAPAGAIPDPEAPGSVSLEGKIAITTQTTGVPSGVRLDDVQVGGRPAVIAHMLGSGDTRTLFAEQTSGIYLEVQVWTGLGWTNSEMAIFADSVHINDDAQTVVG